MRPCSPQDTVTALVDSGASLAIACQRCRDRALFGPRQIAGYESHYRALCRLPLVCRCGSRNLDWFVLDGDTEARTFLA
jgi:DNA-directed RNA polymerase subunit RPC12/RpoP